MAGAPTPITLSAIWASLLMVISSAGVRMICTFEGRRCKNSSRKSKLSMNFVFSPSINCILRSNWVGLQSLSSSAVRNCQGSELANLAISCSFNFWYGSSSGGSKRRSRQGHRKHSCRDGHAATLFRSRNYTIKIELVNKQQCNITLIKSVKF